MKKNTITIDLDSLEFRLGEEYDPRQILDLIYKAQIEPPCTLTEAVEEFGGVRVNNLTETLQTPEQVQQFKSEYLDKEETLEDGIYEAKYIDTVMLHYIKDGRAYSTRDMTKGIPATDLINPVKIAEI